MNAIKCCDRKNKIKGCTSKRVVFSVYMVIFVLYSFICLYPLFWCVCNSLKGTLEYYENSVALPKYWNFGYYLEIFTKFKVGSVDFGTMVWNSVFQTFFWQGVNILVSLCVAYPLARHNFPGKAFFFGVIIFRITIPIIGSGAVTYKFYRELGMINNPLLFTFNFVSGFDLIALILYGYFKGISKEYSDAAYIDGANRLQVMFRIIFPMAFPCVLALYISQIMTTWNNYGTPMIYLPKYPNLAYGIYLFQDEVLFVENGMPIFYGAVILVSLVPIILFSAGQKTMLANMSIGGLKG